MFLLLAGGMFLSDIGLILFFLLSWFGFCRKFFFGFLFYLFGGRLFLDFFARKGRFDKFLCFRSSACIGCFLSNSLFYLRLRSILFEGAV